MTPRVRDLWDQHAANHRMLLQLSADHGAHNGWTMAADIDRALTALATEAEEIQAHYVRLYEARRIQRQERAPKVLLGKWGGPSGMARRRDADLRHAARGG